MNPSRPLKRRRLVRLKKPIGYDARYYERLSRKTNRKLFVHAACLENENAKEER